MTTSALPVIQSELGYDDYVLGLAVDIYHGLRQHPKKIGLAFTHLDSRQHLFLVLDLTEILLLSDSTFAHCCLLRFGGTLLRFLCCMARSIEVEASTFDRNFTLVT